MHAENRDPRRDGDRRAANYFGEFGVESAGGGVSDAGSGDFVVSVAVGAGVVEGVVDVSVFGATFFGAGFCCTPGVFGRPMPAEPVRVGSTVDALPAAVPLPDAVLVAGAAVAVEPADAGGVSVVGGAGVSVVGGVPIEAGSIAALPAEPEP